MTAGNHVMLQEFEKMYLCLDFLLYQIVYLFPVYKAVSSNKLMSKS